MGVIGGVMNRSEMLYRWEGVCVVMVGCMGVGVCVGWCVWLVVCVGV